MTGVQTCALPIFFDRVVPRQLERQPQPFRLGVTVAVDVAGTGQWTVFLRGLVPSIEPGLDPRADLTAHMSEAAFGELLASPEKGTELYYKGALTIAGDLTLAPQVLSFFRLAGGDTAAAKTGIELLMAPMPASQFLTEH